MPNWCNNDLQITHADPKMMEKALDAWNNGKFLGGLVPEPDYTITPVAKTYPHIGASFAKTEEEKAEIMKNEPKIREDAWWDWRVQNWGTKWDFGLEDHEDAIPEKLNGGVLSVFFCSAWSPPIEAYIKLTEMGYEITASYYEGGDAYCGEFENGSDWFYSIEGNSEWVKENIPANINQAHCISENMADWEEENAEEGEDA